MNKNNETTDDIFNEICKKVCLLHLVAMGEFDLRATVRDAQRWHWKINEDCTRCQYNKNCLCCLYVSQVNG